MGCWASPSALQFENACLMKHWTCLAPAQPPSGAITIRCYYLCALPPSHAVPCRPNFADLLPQLLEMLQAARQAASPQPLASRMASARNSAESARGSTELPREAARSPSPQASRNASAGGMPPAAAADAMAGSS